MADRFYIGTAPIELNKEFELPDGEAWHLIKVMRASVGDKIEVFGGGKQYAAEITHLTGKKAFICPIAMTDTVEPLTLNITFALPWLRGGKTELIAQKLTELGVREILIYKAAREVAHGKIDRITKTVLEACKQCGRSDIPIVTEANSILDSFKNTKSQLPQANKILLYENETQLPFCQKLKDFDYSATLELLIGVGPEGGFDPRELTEMNEYASYVTLGSRILRADTAAISAMAAILAISGNM